MRRVSVVGNSGSGKTTFARRLGCALGVPHLELDSVYHQPGWTPLPVGEFRERVARFAEQDAWVIDGNYSAVRELVWERADTVLWLDLPRRTVMRAVLARTLQRGLLGVELWNGNRESLRNLLRREPEENVVLWSWVKHREYRERYVAARADPRWGHLDFVRIRSRREGASWLADQAHCAAARGGG